MSLNNQMEPVNPVVEVDEGAANDTSAIDLGPLPNQVGFMLRLAQLAVFQDFIRIYGTVDIRPAQHSALTIIERNPGIRQCDVGAVLSIKRTNIVPLIDSLEKRGLVKRRQTAADRRARSLFLTDKGRKLMGILDQLRLQHERRVLDLIGEKGRERLLEALSRLARIVD